MYIVESPDERSRALASARQPALASARTGQHERSAELVEAIEASDYAVAGETYSAAYNDPFTPPWRRRNEVLVAVEKRE